MGIHTTMALFTLRVPAGFPGNMGGRRNGWIRLITMLSGLLIVIIFHFVSPGQEATLV